MTEPGFVDSQFKTRLFALMACVGLVWGVSGFALVFDQALVYQLAVIPRRLDGLVGIVGMPLVHGSIGHLIANTLPLLVLGVMLLFRGVRYYVFATGAIIVLGGIALWCFGRDAAHIGASGVVFGYIGLLVTRGFFERRWQSIAVAALVVFVYGGMIWGILPRQPGVSWEAHLFGLVAGIIVAGLAFALAPKEPRTLSGESIEG